MPRPTQRNNVLAGALVLGSIVLAVVAVIMLAGGLELLGKKHYRVRFPLTAGVQSLEPGSEVAVGGLKVGTVTGIRFLDADPDKGVEVTLAVDEGVTLRRDARVYLERPLLGGAGVVNIPTLGEGEPVTDADVLEGRIAPPSFLAGAGFGDNEAASVATIIARAERITGELESLLSEVNARVLPDFRDRIVPNIADASESARSITDDVRAKWPAWSGRVDRITDNVDRTAERGPAIAESVEARLENFRELVGATRTVIDENRANVRDTLANLKSGSEKTNAFLDRLNNELADLAKGFLEEGQTALTSAAEAATNVEDLVKEQRPNIRRTIVNARLASDQLKATLAEVRRSPWRLIYRPDTRELEYELLYDAARAYAGATEDLRAAAESLESAADGEPTDVAQLADDLRARLEAYEQAEDRFLDLLRAEQSGGD